MCAYGAARRLMARPSVSTCRRADVAVSAEVRMSPASGLPTLRMAADDLMSPHMIAGHGAKPASAGAWAWAAATATADRLCEAGKLPARSGVARPVATPGQRWPRLLPSLVRLPLAQRAVSAQPTGRRSARVRSGTEAQRKGGPQGEIRDVRIRARITITAATRRDTSDVASRTVSPHTGPPVDALLG
jgi:hypothetical protein